MQFLETCPESERRSGGTYYLERVLDHSVDGLVIADEFLSDKNISNLQTLGIPFILVNRMVKAFPGRCVLFDNYSKTYDMTRFLLKRGHKRIAFFGTMRKSSETITSLGGVNKALGESELNLDKTDLLCCESENKRAVAQNIIALLSSSRPQQQPFVIMKQ